MELGSQQQAADGAAKHVCAPSHHHCAYSYLLLAQSARGLIGAHCTVLQHSSQNKLTAATAKNCEANV